MTERLSRTGAGGSAWVLAALLGLALAASLAACVRSEESPVQAGSRIDPALRRLAEATPDSVVGVIVRSDRPIGPSELRALRAAGVAPGTVVGRLATGEIRAGAAPGLEKLPWIRYIEAAQTHRVPPPPPRP